jgi:hypothetical protein
MPTQTSIDEIPELNSLLNEIVSGYLNKKKIFTKNGFCFCPKEFFNTILDAMLSKNRGIQKGGILRFDPQKPNCIDYIFSNDNSHQLDPWFSDQFLQRKKHFIEFAKNINQRSFYYPYDKIEKNQISDDDCLYLRIPLLTNRYSNIYFFFYFRNIETLLFLDNISPNYRESSIEILSGLIEEWVNDFNLYLLKIREAGKGIISRFGGNLDIEKNCKIIDETFPRIAKMLTRKDLVQVCRERIYDFNKNNSKKYNLNNLDFHECFLATDESYQCKDFFNNNKYECHLKFIKNLLNWAYWLPIHPFHIGPLRRPDSNQKVDATETSDSSFIALRELFGHIPDNLQFISDFCKLSSVNTPLNNKFLFKYFFGRVISEETQKLKFNYYNNKNLSDNEIAFGLQSLSSIVHYLFADQPLDEKCIRGFIWFVSQYCHQELDIPARIDIQHHLLMIARGEPSLHSLKPFYRDHFFHALEVCFLGHYILDLKINDTQYFWEIVAQRLQISNKSTAKKIVLKLWYLASLLHDIGYWVDIQKSVQELLIFFQNSPLLKEFQNNLLKNITWLSQQISNGEIFNYNECDKPGEDHGVISAYHVLELLKRIADDDKTINVIDYYPAINAILLHNSRKHIVSFNNNPLAFLLIICDSIQEWNRPKLNYSTAPLNILSKIASNNPNTFHDDLTIIKNVELNNKNNCLNFKLEYSNHINVNSNVFNLWIDATENLQRLKDCPLDINIEYITPFYRNKEGKDYHQLYRLRDVANETYMTFLRNWFPDQPLPDGNGISNGCIHYYVDNNENQSLEHLIIHVNTLENKKLLTQGMSEFRNKLASWKLFNEDREFNIDYAVPKYPT